MGYRTSPIIVALEPNLIGSGLQEDLHPGQKLLWTEAANVTFYHGRVRRLLPKGLFRNFGIVEPVTGISQRQLSTGERVTWVACGGTVLNWDGVDQNTITSFSWTENETSLAPATYFDFTHFGDWTVINSGLGAAYLQKQSSGANLPEAPVNVVQFMKKYNFLVAVGHGLNGTKVSWSAADQIEVWTESQSNEAGELSIEDFDTHVRAGNRIGQHISVYAEDQMALVTFINSPFYFGQKTVLDGIGAVGKKAVISDGANNFGVGRNGIWWTDSHTYRYIDEGRMRDYFQENVNWAQASKIIAVRNDITNTLEFFFPMRGARVINEGWSFDPRDTSWSKLLPTCFKVERKLFDYPLEGDFVGRVWLSQSEEMPTALDAILSELYLQTKPMPAQFQSSHGLTDVHIDSEMHEIDLLLKEAEHVEMRYGSSTEINETPKWGSWRPISVGAKTYRAEAGIPSGVYHHLAFQSTAANWKFNLQGFLIFGSIEGTKRDGYD